MVHSRKGLRRVNCPSCGERIELRFAKDHFGVCPQCGEWLSQNKRMCRTAELVDAEVRSKDFDETEEWVYALTREIG